MRFKLHLPEKGPASFTCLPNRGSLTALIISATLTVLLAACSSFTATLEADVVDGSAPLAVVFTNGGSGAESHAWDFGDGSESLQSGTSPTASHTFTKAGTFSVTVNTASGDKTAVSSTTVTVSPGPLSQVNLDAWPGEVAAGSTVEVGAIATDDYGNEVADVSISVAIPAAAGSIDSAGKLTASTSAGEFADGLEVTAALDDTVVTATTDLNVIAAQLDRVEVEPAELELTPTQDIQLTVRAFDVYGNEITGADVELRTAADVGTVGQGEGFTAARSVVDAADGLTVLVTNRGQSAEVTVPVRIVPGPIDSVQITPTSFEADVATSMSFTATAFDGFGNEVPDASISWSTDGVAGLISSNGDFTAGTAAGTFDRAVVATASHGGKTIESSVIVTLTPSSFSQVVVRSAEAVAGEATQLVAVAADRYGNKVDGATLTWSIVDSAVGSITEDGMLSPATHARTYRQSAEVLATKGDQTESVMADIAVVPGELSQVGILPGTARIGMGTEQQYVAAAGDRYGNRILGATLTWSADETAGAIDAEGVFVSGKTPGTYSNAVTVTASYRGKQFSKSASLAVDQDRIIFYSEADNEDGEFVLINTDGTDRTALDIGAYSYGGLTISPDGRQIAYSEWVIDSGILMLDQTAAFPWLLIDHSDDFGYHSPAWSPDGRRMVLVEMDLSNGNRELVLFDIDGGNRTLLTNNANAWEFAPSWSPDGTLVVYDETPFGQNGDIWTINVETGARKRLTTDPANDSEPVFSPDGTKILFFSTRTGNADVFVMNADGSDVVNLTNSPQTDAHAQWSPDGTQIVFVSNRDGNAEIYVMDADGANVTRLTDNSGADMYPVWMPRKLGVPVDQSAVFLTNETASTETVQSLTAKLRQSVVRIVTDAGSGSGFVIREDGYVLTNNHVIRDATSITVHLDDGTQHTATLVGRDLNHDLAVIKVNATGLQPVRFGKIAQDDLGSEVVVLGYPLGSSDLNVTRGVVSSLKADPGTNTTWVQTDAAVNPGNSGGPMLNFQGEVIGLVSAALFGYSVENIGYAVGSVTVLTYLHRLIAGETIYLN